MSGEWYDTDEWFAPGTNDIRDQIKEYQVQIGILQANYLEEIAEYNKVQADFTTIYTKSEYLNAQVKEALLALPEVLLAYENEGIQTALFALNITGGTLGAIVLAAGVAKLLKTSKVITAANSITKVNNLLKVGKVSGALSLVVGIVSTVLSIVNAQEQKEALEENREQLKTIVADINTEIVTVNQTTNEVISALSQFFIDHSVDYTGVFNDSQDGIEDSELYTTAISNLNTKINDAIRDIGVTEAQMKTAGNMLVAGLPAEQVAFFTELPLETVQQIKTNLDEAKTMLLAGSSVDEVVDSTGLPQEIVEKVQSSLTTSSQSV